VFVVAPTGNGRNPSNCDRFYRALREGGLDLSGLRFALLGLGSGYYRHFSRTGAGLDRSLARFSAMPLIPYERSDRAAADASEGAIAGLLSQLTAALGREARAPTFELRAAVAAAPGDAPPRALRPRLPVRDAAHRDRAAGRGNRS